MAYLRASPCRRPVTDMRDVPDAADNLEFILQRLVRAGIGYAVVVPLAAEEEPGFAAARVLVPELESPPGDRRQRFGKRALRTMMGAQ
jgi:ribosomal protein S12 methylthiotransferase accessory factor